MALAIYVHYCCGHLRRVVYSISGHSCDFFIVHVFWLWIVSWPGFHYYCDNPDHAGTIAALSQHSCCCLTGTQLLFMRLLEGQEGAALMEGIQSRRCHLFVYR